MEEKDIPVLNYALSRPRSMRKKVLVVAVAVCAAGVAIAVGRTLYSASRAQAIPTGGIVIDRQIQWQPATPGDIPGGPQETPAGAGSESAGSQMQQP